MNMNKALQNLYHAVSDETTTKVNISKLLVDIHYAITGKESENKNNWSKIVNSMADNWPEGGGGGTTVEALSVTQNGTYTAPSGKAYSPVTVNVSGGSSDFSTAEVTIVANNTLGSCTVPRCIEAGELAPEAPAMLDAIVSFENEEIVFNAVLYKGMAVADFASNRVTSVTGDAMWDEEDSSVYIMGNCTITVTDA